VETNAVTVSQILDRYEAECLHELAPRTQRDYRRHLNHLRNQFGHLLANELKPKDFGPFLQIPPGKKGRIQRVRQLAVLSSAFTHAVSFWYVMDRNVLRDVKRPKSKPRTRYVTHAEYDGVRLMSPKRVRLAMEIAYYTGQRQGDVIGLKWVDIDDRIHFVQGKTGKRIGMRIGPKLEKTLDECWNLPSGGCDGGEYVITRRCGGRYTSEGFRALWQRSIGAWVRLGNRRFNFHDLRAKCVSDSKSLQAASDRAGHQDQTMTKRVYDRNEREVDSLDLEEPADEIMGGASA
jgi:integrase